MCVLCVASLLPVSSPSHPRLIPVSTSQSPSWFFMPRFACARVLSTYYTHRHTRTHIRDTSASHEHALSCISSEAHKHALSCITTGTWPPMHPMTLPSQECDRCDELEGPDCSVCVSSAASAYHHHYHHHHFVSSSNAIVTIIMTMIITF